jgi:hypothetical protein
MSAILDTGPPNQGAFTVTSREGRQKLHNARGEAGTATIARIGRRTQLTRFVAPLCAVWKALDWCDWEELRVRAQRKENASCRS